MINKLFATIVVVLATICGVSAQTSQPAGYYPPSAANPMDKISTDITAISKSVDALNKNMSLFIEKLGGSTNALNSQQKLLTGLQILNQAEQRFSTLQNMEIDLQQKQVSTRTRIIQIDQEMRPESIDRSVAFDGTTRTNELKDSKRQSLSTEKAGLTTLLADLDLALTQTRGEAQEARSLVSRLRKRFLPQIERQLRELGDQ